jgi:Nuclease-related domain
MDREPWPRAKATGPQAPADAQDNGSDDSRGHPLGGPARPAGGRAYAGLASNPRISGWIGRAVAAAVVGTAVSIWANWRIGVTSAAVVVIGDIIYRSKTTSLIPASDRVTSAQRRSRRRLARLQMSGYVSLNARAIPNTQEVIDHLVVGPAGVFALDSEHWDRRLPVRATTGNQLYHGPFSQRDRLEHARWEAAQASRLLGQAVKRAVDVRPVMVIYGPKIPWNVASLHGVDVFSGSRLRKYFRNQVKGRRAARLDTEEISLIRDAAEQALPPVTQ